MMEEKNRFIEQESMIPSGFFLFQHKSLGRRGTWDFGASGASRIGVIELVALLIWGMRRRCGACIIM